MTAHSPRPEALMQEVGRSISMALTPVSVGVTSFHSIFCVTKRSGLWSLKTWRCGPSTIDPVPLAIHVPTRLVPLLSQNSLVWKPVGKDIPSIDLAGSSFENITTQQDESVTYWHLPATALVKGDRYRPIRQYSHFAKLQVLIAGLQLLYSAWQAYSMYQALFLDLGMSSPVIVALPALYSSFLNMLANLVQKTYTHVIILPPASRLSSTNTTLAAEIDIRTTIPRSESPSSITSDIEFDDWFTANYPDIELNEDPSLEHISFLAHHLLSIIVILTCLGLLSGFRSSGETSIGYQTSLLVSVFVDPVLHLCLALLQRMEIFEKRVSKNVELGMVGGVKIVVWLGNGWGWYNAGKMWFKIYSGNLAADE